MSENQSKCRQILLTRRPQGRGVTSADLDFVEVDCTEPGEGQVRVRVIYISVDPATRLWMNEDPPVVPPMPLGSVVTSMGIGIVEASNDSRLGVGTLVHGFLGWQSHFTCNATHLTVLPPAPSLPLTAHLSLLGPIGLTAYFGLLELAKPKSEETLLVSGAAGAVGSLVGQIGKIQGCRVIGIAGGAEKCRFLVNELGFDEALDYKNEDVGERLASLSPSGIDVFFDNVGGAIHDAVVPHLNEFGRVVYCGEISSGYETSKVTTKISSLEIIVKALQLMGLRVDLYYSRADEAVPSLAYWALSGQLKHRIHVIDGLENTLEALNMVFAGKNHGKMVVQVSPEPELSRS